MSACSYEGGYVVIAPTTQAHRSIQSSESPQHTATVIVLVSVLLTTVVHCIKMTEIMQLLLTAKDGSNIINLSRYLWALDMVGI